MCVIPERVSIASVILLLCATVAAVAPLADAADADSDRSNPMEAAAIVPAERSTPAPSATPMAANIPSVQSIEAEDAITGSEPDPETFDRRGLEMWWQRQGAKKTMMLAR